MTAETERTQVITEARTWTGTPFIHGAQLKGIGVDCAHLLVAAFGVIDVAVDVPRYSPDWFLHSGRQLLTDLIDPVAARVDDPDVGDIATFVFGRAVSHAGIIVAPGYMIHAYRPARAVRVDELRPGSALWPRLSGYYRLNRWAE